MNRRGVSVRDVPAKSSTAVAAARVAFRPTGTTIPPSQTRNAVNDAKNKVFCGAIQAADASVDGPAIFAALSHRKRMPSARS